MLASQERLCCVLARTVGTVAILTQRMEAKKVKEIQSKKKTKKTNFSRHKTILGVEILLSALSSVKKPGMLLSSKVQKEERKHL